MVNVPLQGDIIKLNLDPKQGHEQSRYRPYMCLSYKMISDTANVAIFAPISNTKRRYPFYVSLMDCKTTGVVMLDQLVTIDYKHRHYHCVESVSSDVLLPILRLVPLLFQYNYDDGEL